MVHWVGEEEPTWEPWTNVRRTVKLHEYIQNHPKLIVRNLLPANFSVDTHLFSDEETNTNDNDDQ